MIVYVGSYTSNPSEGIYVYQMDRESGELTLKHTVGNITNPSFLTLDSQHRFLYAVQEVSNYNGEFQGAVSAFLVDQKSWNLTPINSQPSFGTSPCYVAVDGNDHFAMLANYSSGTLALYPLKEDGSLASASHVVQHEGSSVNKNRQNEPHAHSVNPAPNNRFVLAADLGIDKILVYQLDSAGGKLLPNDPPSVSTQPGAGPRHFTFSPDGRFCYVINELNSSLAVYSWDAEAGELKSVETFSTLPQDYKGTNSCADVHITPDGRFLYGSNRGLDSLSIFSIDSETGKLTPAGYQSTMGQTPRNFAIDPTGTFLLVANQNSDNVVVFRINKQSGELTETGCVVSVSKPVCIKVVLP
ncbi:lactonase family protein [candidate division KSB1 bacterium]|nr:lactonase family protein [candidate division KSB1 bacterium]